MPSVQQVFNITAATYDRDRAKLIPCFDRLYATAIDLIPENANHILDLGVGTGLLASFVRARFPHAYLHMIDNSEAMLEKAKELFSRDQETAFGLGDYTSIEWGSEYDAIVSALSIHHLDDPTKQALFTRIHAALKPGGVFINAEQVLGPTPALEARYKQQWLAQVRALGATEEQVNASLFRQQEDRCASVEDQLLWMRTAGFADADCAFKDGRFAVLHGSR